MVQLTLIGFGNILLIQKAFYSSANINTLCHLFLCTALPEIHLQWTFIDNLFLIQKWGTHMSH